MKKDNDNLPDNMWEFLHLHKLTRRTIAKAMSNAIIIIAKGLSKCLVIFGIFAAIALFLWTLNYIFPGVIFPDMTNYLLKK